MYLLREKLVLNLHYPRISGIIVKNQKDLDKDKDKDNFC